MNNNAHKLADLWARFKHPSQHKQSKTFHSKILPWLGSGISLGVEGQLNLSDTHGCTKLRMWLSCHQIIRHDLVFNRSITRPIIFNFNENIWQSTVKYPKGVGASCTYSRPVMSHSEAFAEQLETDKQTPADEHSNDSWQSVSTEQRCIQLPPKHIELRTLVQGQPSLSCGKKNWCNKISGAELLLHVALELKFQNFKTKLKQLLSILLHHK